MKNLILSLSLLISTFCAFAQQATVIDPRSMTVPRYADLTAIQAAITSPQTGMMVYNSGTETNWIYNGTTWVNTAGAGASQWNTAGQNIYYNNTISSNNPNSTYTATPNIAIPDNNTTGVISTLNVPLTGVVINPDLITISMAINHTYAADLVITLIAPTGENFILVNRLGASNQTTTYGWEIDFVSTNLININKTASGQIPNINPIPAGTYLPSAGSAFTSSNLDALFNIQVNGTWSLKVQDLFGPDPGTLVSWSINFGANSLGSVGKVGIGNANPTAMLDVQGSVNARSLQTNSIQTNSIQTNSIQTNSIQTNSINATGNLGIGTSSPSAYGHGGSQKVLEINNNGTSANAQAMLMLSSDATQNGSLGNINFIGKGSPLTEKRMAFIGSSMDASASGGGNLYFWTNNAGTISEKMVISKEGNVGINDNSPSAKLSIAGKIKIVDGTQGANKILASDANGLASWQNFSVSQWTTSGININYAGGNVGIGTTNPTHKLHIGNNPASSGEAGLRIDGSVTTGGVAASIGEFGDFAIDKPSVTAGRFVVKDDGKVGIDKAAPLHKLHIGTNPESSGVAGLRIDGSVSTGGVAASIGEFGDFAIDKPSVTAGRFVVKDDGKTGINEAAPNSSLEVNGSFATKITTISSGNVSIDETATIWYFTGGNISNLPTASSCTNRRYMIVAVGNSVSLISGSYKDLTGGSVTSITANSSIEIISNGSDWLQIR